MKKTGKCPKCESRNLLGNVARPLLAWICTDCGYTELYTHDPKALMEAFRENQANQ